MKTTTTSLACLHMYLDPICTRIQSASGEKKEERTTMEARKQKNGEGEPSACSSLGEMWGKPGEMRLKIGRIQRGV